MQIRKQPLPFKHIFFLTLFIHAFTYASFSQSVTKDENGVYKFKSDYIPELIESGLTNPKVSVMWQSLMGEPIEDYKFYWERGRHAYRGEYLEDVLHEYPDLLQRYMDLRPSFKISFHVKIGCSNSGNCSHSFEHIVSSNDMVVKRAGEVANFSVPSSYSWEHFFGLNEQSPTPDKTEEMKQAFISGETIEVVSTWLFDIEWPQSIEFIWEELQRRRKHQSTKGKKNADRKESNSEWATEENQSNSFSDDNTEESEWATTTNQNGNSDEADNSDTNSSEWAIGDSNTNDEWSSSSTNNPSQKSNAFIERRNGKYGVIDTVTDQVLIPFRYEGILKFENGLATISSIVNQESIDCESSSYYGSLIYFQRGVVDVTGNYIIPPYEVIKTQIGSQLQLLSGDDSEERRAYRKRQDDRCIEYLRGEIKEARQRIISSGGIVEEW
ncbi:MAG: WG repeat-containing protein [Flavobacteriales bacterium]